MPCASLSMAVAPSTLSGTRASPPTAPTSHAAQRIALAPVIALTSSHGHRGRCRDGPAVGLPTTVGWGVGAAQWHVISLGTCTPIGSTGPTVRLHEGAETVVRGERRRSPRARPSDHPKDNHRPASLTHSRTPSECKSHAARQCSGPCGTVAVTPSARSCWPVAERHGLHPRAMLHIKPLCPHPCP